jgi:HipA-like protein
MNLFAKEHVRRMKGGAQAHLMRCSDDAYYVVKFQNNPQGTRTLANDLFGTLLAKRLGLPVAEGAVVEVSDRLINLTEELAIDHGRTRISCLSGRSFGSRYVSTIIHGESSAVEPHETYLSQSRLKSVTNLADVIGTLVFDIWTCNRDTRQFVFVRNPGVCTWTATMIDQGMCFNGESWCFCDNLKGRIYCPWSVYESVTGIESFEPWLNRLENDISAPALKQIASEIPPEWYEADPIGLRRLVNVLDERRSTVRSLLWRTLGQQPLAFPNWTNREKGEEQAFSRAAHG